MDGFTRFGSMGFPGARLDATPAEHWVGTTATAYYTPIVVPPLRYPRDLPRLNAEWVRRMLSDSAVQLALAARKAPLLSVEFAYQEQGRWLPGVRASDPAIGQFVHRQLQRLWKRGIARLLDSAQIWGCAILRFLTLDVVVDPFAQKFSVIDCGEAFEEPKRREPLVYDYGDAEGFATNPNTISVQFAKFGQRSDGKGNAVATQVPSAFSGYWYGFWFGWGTTWGLWRDYWLSNHYDIAIVVVTVTEKDIPELKGGLGGVAVYDSTSADYTTTPFTSIPIPISLSDEDIEITRKRAVKLARRWLARHKRDSHYSQKHYAGVVETVPNQAVHMVRWRDYGDGSGAVTELHYGERPDPERPYLIETGIIGRGVWQVAPTEKNPKLTVDFLRFPRVSNVPVLSQSVPVNEKVAFLYSAITPVGYESGGASLPSVLGDQEGRLIVQEDGSYRVHFHCMLGIGDADANPMGWDNGTLLRISLWIVRKLDDDQDETVKLNFLTLTRKHFAIPGSEDPYSHIDFVSAENVAGERVVPLRAGDWLEVRNTSDGPGVRVYDGWMTVIREDRTK